MSAAGLAAVAVGIALLSVRSHEAQPYAGDEPHYLLVTTSLFLDGDVDVKNDYVTGRYLRYYPYPIDPHVNGSIFKGSSRHWYPTHGIGLSMLLVPGVLAADVEGAKLTMVFVAAAVLVLAFFWTRRFTGENRFAFVAAAALGVSPFFLGLEGRIFPDLATAALLLGALLLLELPERRQWHLALLGVLVGIAPWLHFKNALAFATIAAIAFVQVARGTRGSARARDLALLAAPIAVSLIGYEVSLEAWYGSLSPTRMFPPGNQAFALSEARGLAAASFDSARGLLANNPALLLILPGLPVWLSRWRGAFLRLALVLGPTILVQATFNDWSGGYSPPGRYALQFTPALVPAIALALREASGAFRVLAVALLGLQLALAAAFVWLRPWWGYAGFRNPLLAGVDKHLGVALDRALPTFDARATLVHGGGRLAAWMLVAATLVVYGATRLARTS